MKKYILNILSTFAVVITGCATAYQPGGLTGGYESTQLDENIFRVSFRGNGFVSSTKAADYTLLQCAELCKGAGYSYFQIIESEKHIKRSTSQIGPGSETTTTTGRISSSGSFRAESKTTTRTPTVINIAKPSVENTIICYKDKPIEGVSYTADFMIKSLKQKYNIQK